MMEKLCKEELIEMIAGVVNISVSSDHTLNLCDFYSEHPNVPQKEVWGMFFIVDLVIHNNLRSVENWMMLMCARNSRMERKMVNFSVMNSREVICVGDPGINDEFVGNWAHTRVPTDDFHGNTIVIRVAVSIWICRLG